VGAVRELFSRGRANRPAVLFLDEIDALVAKRHTGTSNGGAQRDAVQERVLATLLNEMDGVETADGVLVVVRAHSTSMRGAQTQWCTCICVCMSLCVYV
jgi:transitional endoplasmic reticulum ATPase